MTIVGGRSPESHSVRIVSLKNLRWCHSSTDLYIDYDEDGREEGGAGRAVRKKGGKDTALGIVGIVGGRRDTPQRGFREPHRHDTAGVLKSKSSLHGGNSSLVRYTKTDYSRPPRTHRHYHVHPVLDQRHPAREKGTRVDSK